ncbi:methyl-accepting chemotaxis protein [Paenibacillus sp. strain BS8-2]
MRLTLGKKLFSGFMAVLLVMSITIVLSYTQVSKVERHFTELIEGRAANLIMIQQLNINVKKEMASLRGYLLLQDPASLQSFTDAHTAFKKQATALQENIAHPDAIVLLENIIDLENQYYFSSNSSIKLLVKGDSTKAMELAIGEGQEIMQRFDQETEALSAFQQTLLHTEQLQASDEVKDIKRNILILGVIALIVSFIVSRLVGRMISRPVIQIAAAAEAIAQGDLTSKTIRANGKDELGDLARSFQAMTSQLRELIHHVGHNAEQVAASAEQLSATSEQTSLASDRIAQTMQEVAEDVSQQSHHIGEASQTIHNMSANARLIAEHAQSVSANASDAYSQAAKGEAAAQTAIKQMDSLHTTVTNLAALIKTLQDRSNGIGAFLQVISDIAKQTNILSLNAGIEAARAGDQGKGFAVVAVEIRRLAEQSASSAEQISLLVQAIRQETHNAVDQMAAATHEVDSSISAVNHTGEALSRIQGSVNSVNDQIGEVSSSIQQMAAGAEQLVHAMSIVSAASETTSSGTQEVSAGAEEQLASMSEVAASARSLTELAERLQVQIERFKM